MESLVVGIGDDQWTDSCLCQENYTTGSMTMMHRYDMIDGVCGKFLAIGYERRINMETETEKNIRYWIYEFEMSDKTKREFEAVCAMCEMTADEFFQAAVRDAIRRAKEDPEGLKKDCLELSKTADQEIRLIRCYPVHKGETEAQARKQKLAEEALQE